MAQECNVVYETVCPTSSNYYNYPKRRKKRTVALVRSLIRAKQNHWSRKKQFVRNRHPFSKACLYVVSPFP